MIVMCFYDTVLTPILLIDFEAFNNNKIMSVIIGKKNC